MDSARSARCCPGLGLIRKNACQVSGKRVESFSCYGMWLSLVERSVRDAEAEGSNPFIPTRILGTHRYVPFFVVSSAPGIWRHQRSMFWSYSGGQKIWLSLLLRRSRAAGRPPFPGISRSARLNAKIYRHLWENVARSVTISIWVHGNVPPGNPFSDIYGPDLSFRIQRCLPGLSPARPSSAPLPAAAARPYSPSSRHSGTP